MRTRDAPASPGSPGGPRVLRALMAMFAANGFVYASFVPRLADVRDQVGMSTAALGTALSLGSLAALAASFLIAPVIAVVGGRRIVVAGGVCYALALPAVAFAGTPALVVAAVVGLAVFDVFVDAALNLQASAVGARRTRPVMSRLHGLWSVGTLTGGAAAAGAAQLGVPVGPHDACVAGLVVVTVVVAGRHLLPVDQEAPGPPTHAEASPPAVRRAWWPVLGSGTLLLVVANAMAETVETTTGEWSGLRLRDDLAVRPGAAAAAFVGFTVGMVAGRSVGDHVTARWGRTRTVRGCVLLAASGALLTTASPTAGAALAGVVLVGVGASVLGPLLAEAAARAPGRPGSGFTALLVGHRAAGLYVPAAVGLLADSPGLSVGAAMALVLLPSLACLAAVAGRLLDGPRPSGDGHAGCRTD